MATLANTCFLVTQRSDARYLLFRMSVYLTHSSSTPKRFKISKYTSYHKTIERRFLVHLGQILQSRIREFNRTNGLEKAATAKIWTILRDILETVRDRM